MVRQRDGRRLILLPNLICVAGAFFLGFNGLTSVLVSNIGTYSLFRTCNVWTAEALKRSGQKMSLWSPFSFQVMGLLSDR